MFLYIHSHCLLFCLGLCDGHFKPPYCPPSFKHSLESSAPFHVVNSSHPGGVELSRRGLFAYHTAHKATNKTSELQEEDAATAIWIIYLWLVRAGSDMTTTLVFPNDSRFENVQSDCGILTPHRTEQDSFCYMIYVDNEELGKRHSPVCLRPAHFKTKPLILGK